jgi:tetratricopeptide (TPR) repeat protein
VGGASKVGADEAADVFAPVDEAVAAGDADRAIVLLSAAVRDQTDRGDRRRAAMACARLGDVFASMLGNKVAARPWFVRAERLVEDEPPCIEQGYVAIASMGCDVDDPAELIARAELALDRARRFGDVDLEVKALADGGLAHVEAGRVVDGMAMLDEAMALACGRSGTDLDLLGRAACSFYTACYHAADFQRVDLWSREFRRVGLISATPGSPAQLRSHCDSMQGTLLCHVGRWSEAEAVLTRASTEIEEVMPGTAWHPPIALAELRIQQGRLDEAEALLLGRDDHIQALLPTARLHLERGDHDLARAVARRGLRLIGDDRLRAAALLSVVAGAELGRGDVEAARRAADELEQRLDGLPVPVLTADAARVRAKVLAAEGDTAAAITVLEDGLARLGELELPLVRVTLHVDLARLLDAPGQRAEAIVEARAAAALLARLDVVLGTDVVDLFGRLGVDVSSSLGRPGCRLATLERDGKWWTAGCADTAVRLPDTKGLRYLAELVTHPGAERHVLDLVDLVEGVGAGVDRRHLGDAGELLDATARTTYRRRVEELRDDVEDALAIGDDERAAALQAELDALVGELARAFGLGGRQRTASSASERARLNVTRALRAAIARLSEALPEAGAVLDRRVRTGFYCAYEPHTEDDILWNVFSPD